jgi:hypothetical protein
MKVKAYQDEQWTWLVSTDVTAAGGGSRDKVGDVPDQFYARYQLAQAEWFEARKAILDCLGIETRWHDQ